MGSKITECKDERPKFVMIDVSVLGTITPTALAVYAAIIKHADNQTRNAWPSHSTIATLANCSVSSVKRAIAELRDAGLISVEKIGKVGAQHNRYTVLARDKNGSAKKPPTPVQFEPTPVHKEPGPSSKRTMNYTQEPNPKNQTESKHGSADALIPTLASNSALSESDFAWAICVLDEASIEWRPEQERDSGGVRSLWGLTFGTTAERREQFSNAAGEAANYTTTAAGLFHLAMKSLRGEAFAAPRPPWRMADEGAEATLIERNAAVQWLLEAI